VPEQTRCRFIHRLSAVPGTASVPPVAFAEQCPGRPRSQVVRAFRPRRLLTNPQVLRRRGDAIAFRRVGGEGGEAAVERLPGKADFA
jgi:hypothetical protein